MCSMKSPEAGAAIGGGPDALLSAVTDVAERSFFAMVEPLDEPRFAAASEAVLEWLIARVSFADSRSQGTVLCHLPAALADRLFDGFSGRDAGDPAPLVTEVHDLVGEFANMVCGSWLTRAANDRTFALCKPEVQAVAALAIDPATALCIDIDGSPCAIEIAVAPVADPVVA